jgi:hypothetical protein
MPGAGPGPAAPGVYGPPGFAGHAAAGGYGAQGAYAGEGAYAGYGYGPPQHWPMPPAGYYYAYAPAGAAAPGNTAPMGDAAGQGRRAGMAELIEELGSGGNGLSSLSRILNLDDSEFWKGALVGAAAVLLLTNDSVQDALFKTGARAKGAVQGGVDKLKERADDASTKTADQE